MYMVKNNFIMVPTIFIQDWFQNRNSLGKYIFDTSGAIYNFNNNSVGSILYGSRLNELYKDPRKFERECEAINSLINHNKPVNVTIHKKNKDCYTDGRSIVISGLPLVDYKENGIDIVLGFLTHESSHIRFTDFEVCKKVSSKYLHWVWNLIEDEVIEEMLQIEKPGLGNVLGPVKDWMFNDSSEKTEFEDDLSIINYILFNIIRYPINLKNVPEEYFIKFEDLFNDIYAILKSNNVLNISLKDNSTIENYKAAKEIVELLKQYIEENKITTNGNDNESEDADNTKNGNKNDGNENGSLDDSIGEDGEPTSKSFDNIQGTILANSSGESIENKGEVIKNLSKFPIEVEDYDIEYKEKEQDALRGNSPTKYLKKINAIAKAYNTEKYTRYAKLVKPYINTIKKINIQNKKMQMTLKKEEYARNGSLDPRLLASAIQNIKNVYQRHGIHTIRKPSEKFTIAITLDESGSMEGKYTREIVDKIAIAFAEAFKDNNDINLYIYGHSDYIVRYIDPLTKKYDILIDRCQGMGQNEVQAYNTIIKDIDKETKSNILLINITDSQYLANYSEIENELSKWNKKIFQSLIVINNNLTSKDIQFNDRVYGKYNWAQVIDINDIDKTNKELTKIVKYINKLANKFKK